MPSLEMISNETGVLLHFFKDIQIRSLAENIVKTSFFPDFWLVFGREMIESLQAAILLCVPNYVKSFIWILK